MSERRAGWYHVVTGDGMWNCAMWNGAQWFSTFESYIKDTDFEVIGDYIPTPDEPFKCVPVEPTAEMVEAASEAYMPFGDMALAIQAAIVYAPGGEGEQ